MNDHKSDLLALRDALLPLGQPILTAETAQEGLRLAANCEVAVAIIDIRMPIVDGFGLVEAMRREPKYSELPVMFVSALEATPELVDRVYALGAVDFVSMPVRPAMLRSKVAVFVELHRQTLRERKYANEVREAAALEVQAQQERFRLLVESVSDYALFFMDPLGLVTEWTVSAERLLGYPAADALNQHFRFIFTPDDRATGAPEMELEVAVTNGQSRDDQVHVRRDGTRVPVTGRTIALRDHDGSLRGFAKIMRDATQLRALRESEAKFREIFETANEGIWILSSDTVIEVANRRIAEILGYEVPELIGRRKADFVFPEDQAYIAGLFEERRSGKIQAAIEVRFRHKSGKPVWTLLSARPIFRDGKFAGALDMFTDITARREAVNRFRVFFESSAAGHALLDPAAHRFLQVNDRFCEIVGRSAAELGTLTCTDITHPDDKAAHERQIADLRARRIDEVVAELRYVRPDGSAVWVQLTTAMVRAPDGTPEVQVGVVQDITARRTAELELAESRTRLRLAIDTADLGVFYHDGATGAITWSPQLKQMLGVAPGEKESLDLFRARVHPDDRPRVVAAMERIFHPADQPTEWELEYRVVWPDGTVRWLISNGVSNPPLDQGRNTFRLIGTVRDVTAEKEFESELRRQIAERTRELDEKTQQLESFCYTVAHDLRAPLRAINGYADFALEDLAPANRPDTVEYLERIRSSTKRLDTLITDLLAYSRISQVAIRGERVELQRVVETVLHELEPEIRQRAAKVTVDANIPPAVGEQSILEQIMLNLVGNALKFSRPGDPPRVEIFAEDGNRRVRVNVRDHGIGVPRQYHGRIFKVFERLNASRQYPGTGIGLAIVARGVERLGGRYGVESEPDRGSTFWFELERADG